MQNLIPAAPAAYQDAARALASGKAVALPTETVYGLAAMASDESAVRALYVIKDRPPVKPLPVLVFSAHQAADLAEVSPLAQRLMAKFWPGPLTLVLPLKPGADIAPTALAGGKTIALRCADIGWAAHKFYAGFTRPLVLTSANTSGAPSPVTAAEVASDLGSKLPVIIDGGPCNAGEPSAIVSLVSDDMTILRQGAIPAADILKFGA